MTAISSNSGSSIADRMRERIQFIRMCETGLQPQDIVKEASARGQAELKAYGEQLECALQGRQVQMQTVATALVDDVANENVLRAAEDQIDRLAVVHAEAQQKHGDLVDRIKGGEQCLHEQAESKKMLSAQLEGLKKIAKNSLPGPTETKILTIGSQMCENLAHKK